MAFEIKDRDLLGRIGKINTKSGNFETPTFMPVINPFKQIIPARKIFKEFGCHVIMTNSYILWKNLDPTQEIDIHHFLDYPGVVTTDSGAYQILVYGSIEINQNDIIEFQKKIDSDIATILDIPTGWDLPRELVEYSVEETIRRAEIALPQLYNSDALWMGPIQGGRHLDLIVKSAKKIGEMPYHIHALGSPTEVMERYLYTVLVDMIMAAKKNIPPDRPLHLFGAGHPMMLSMAVALGCDLFDSASYALYAKKDRYITTRGTKKILDLKYLPCNCSICRNLSASELKAQIKSERTRLLAEHNLNVLTGEIKTIKQAIAEGTLWKLLEARTKGHPSLISALKRISKYSNDIEKNKPGFKGHGISYYDYHSLSRPELTRYQRLLKENYAKPEDVETLLLLKAPPTTPYRRNEVYVQFELKLLKNSENLHICFYSVPYGCVPADLSETFPLSQYEIAEPLDYETIKYAAKNLSEYLTINLHKRIILLIGKEDLDYEIKKVVLKIAEEKEVKLQIIEDSRPWSNKVLEKIIQLLRSENR
jgi:7-cyano-7-deazaguanine tRNA-ribosyltransferase